jgi:anti-sigma B factor antagonist
MNIWQRQIDEADKLWLVGVRGRLDHSLTSELELKLNDLLNDGHTQLLVDLTEVEYINSGGLRCLVSAWRNARQQQGDVRLCGLNTRLTEIFGMVGFDKVFQIYTTCDAAQKELRQP